MAGAAACLLAIASTATTASAASNDGSATLTGKQIARRVQPATELIETDVSGTLTYYQLGLDTKALVNWANQDANFLNYATAGDYADATRAMIKEIGAHPGAYLYKGNAVPYDDRLVFSGSGWNVTPDGYIVTNAHVATVSTDDAIQGFLADTLQPVVDGLTQSFKQQLGQITFDRNPLPVPDDETAAVDQLITSFIDQSAEVGEIKTTVYVGGGPTLSRNLTKQGQVATVVDAGEVYPGKDVAILKIEAHNLPTIPLGDDAALQIEDPVHAIGYPGDATFDPTTISDTVTAQSTVTDGTVSNRLQSKKGNFQFIENTATINHGNSGGALVNAQGQLVGMPTAVDSSTEAKNGDNGGKLFYAVPVSVVKEFLDKNHVVPVSSPDQAVFNHAVDLMDQSHYSAALKDLRQAQTDGFTTPYLQQRLDEANAALAAGKDKPLSSSSPIALIGAIAAAVVVIGGLVIAVVVIRRRHRTVPPSAGDAGGVPGVVTIPRMPVGVAVASYPSPLPSGNGQPSDPPLPPPGQPEWGDAGVPGPAHQPPQLPPPPPAGNSPSFQ